MSTRIYVQNNTPFGFDVSWERSGAPLKADCWKRGTATVKGGRKAKMLEFNRDTGITNGKLFYFTTTLSGDDSQLELQQKLKGTTIGSTLWQSVKGPDFSNSWYSDRATHTATWKSANRKIGVRYSAYYTGGFDDVEYVLHYTYGVAPSDENTLNLLSYNVYLRPSPPFINGQAQRTEQLPAQIKGYDVLVFCEAFDNTYRGKLLSGLKPEYPYATRVVGADKNLAQDGGVIIASRWPIRAQDQKLFGSVSSGSDSMADKGVLYARIDKKGRIYHVFATHTQADSGTKDQQVRRKQLQMIRSFIVSKKIPATEPVIIAGDLNVNKANQSEYNDMLEILKATSPATTGVRYSFYPTINDLASGSNEMLDYVLWSNTHLAPVSAKNEVRMPRAAKGWKDLLTENERWDLSDHFPVYSRLTFKPPK